MAIDTKIDPTSTVSGTEVKPADPSLIDTNDFDDYAKAKLRIDRLISDFASEIEKTKVNRDDRFKELNIKELRDKQILKDNQFMIPVRVIDSNIRREQPSFVNYLRQSRRILLFESLTNPSFVPNKIEDEFTRGNQYSGWELPHFKVIDGSQTHGWDFVEVEFDISKPLHVAVTHVGHDNLIFPLDTLDFQSCELIIRCHFVTPRQLKRFVVNYGFEEDEVNNLIQKNSQTRKESSLYVYKCFWKFQDVVYVAWYAQTCAKWLKAPEKLYLGVQVNQQVPTQSIDPMTGLPTQTMQDNWVDADENEYPFFILPYYETEQQKIADHKGRAFLDKHKQQALTANLSQFLNGCQLGSTILPSLKTEALRQSEIQSITIGDGKVPPVPIEYTSPPYPDSVMLQLQSYLDVFNSQEAGQINYAAQNRKDSRKTATEIAAAQQENTQLSSVQVVLYSTFIREVYSFIWRIVQSRAIQNKITFLVDPQTGQNDIESISQNFDLKAAGDVDVVKRQELIQQYKEFWPIMMNTPAALPFLSRLLQLAFPDEGDTYAQILAQGDPRALIVSLAQILESVTSPEDIANIPPAQKQVFINILEQAKAMGEQFMAQAGSPGQAPKPPGQPQQNTQNG